MFTSDKFRALNCQCIKVVKAMDQHGHVTRFLLYRHFNLYDPISIKIKKENWKFVEFNKIH